MNETSRQPPNDEIPPGDEPQPQRTEEQARIAKLAAEESLIREQFKRAALENEAAEREAKAQSTKEQTEQVKKEVAARPGRVFRDKLKGGGAGPEMIIIEAGKFMMGSPQTERGWYKSEGPQHSVTISRPFALSIDS